MGALYGLSGQSLARQKAKAKAVSGKAYAGESARISGNGAHHWETVS